MIRRLARAAALVTCTVLPACGFAPVDTLDALNSPGETIPLRAAYWVPPEFRSMNGHFPMPFPIEGVDERRAFPNGVRAVARSVFADSHETPTMDAAFADTRFDVVMAPELTGVSGQVEKPLMLRILWRVWTKDRSVVWLDTITTSQAAAPVWSRYDMFNRLVRDQFEQAATAMRTGSWWTKLAPHE